MPKVVTFNGRQIIEPGAYSQIKSGVPVAPVTGSSGNVCIIDTGSGAGYGWGAGINGELSDDAASVYQFNSLLDSKTALRGGILWDLMDFLWSPSTNSNGIASLFYVRAATTVAAKLAMSDLSSGAITFAAKNEGTGGNGVLVGTVLTRGYAVTLRAGVIDSTKFIMEFYEGQYRGKDADGVEYDTAEADLTNYLITRSTEFSSVNDLIAWANDSFEFNNYFSITASTASATALTSADITEYGGKNVFIGGTTAYNATDVDAVLGAIEDMDNSFFLCDDYGITPSPAWTSGELLAGKNKGALSSANTKILAYILNTSTYTEKIMFVGGGKNANEFSRPTSGDGSIQIAQYYNNMCVVTAHSAVQIPSRPRRYLPTIYNAAMALGRTSGMESQVPLTYKSVRINGVAHDLKKTQREQALLAGVLHYKNVPTMGWVVNQGINTVQQNQNLYNTDGSSPEISIVRIIQQINKELKINGTPRFTGTNLNTSSAEDVKAFTQGYLNAKTATRLVDNLIISFNSITAVLDQDSWKVTYCIVINGPINRTFFTGYIMDPSVQA